jgi:hypothetical protein
MLNYIESAGMKSKPTKMPVNMRASMSKDCVFKYDPERVPHIDILHEIRHARQIKKGDVDAPKISPPR